MAEKQGLLEGSGPHPGYGGQGYPPQGGGYPPQAGGYPPQAGGYPPQGAYQQGGPPPQGGAPPYPPAGAYQQGPPPPQGGPPGYPPAGAYQQQAGPPQGAPPGPGNDVVPTFKGEVPEHDMEDNPNAQAPTPSAPPLEKMDTVSGYENIGFSAAVAPPPSYEEATRPTAPEQREFRDAPNITEEQAREALLSFVAEHCCFGSGAAKNMKIHDLISTSAFQYQLESFGESRSTAWAFEPFSGQFVDGPQNGPAPGPWDIQVAPPTMFKNEKRQLEVPHTASIKPCHNCLAMGCVRCFRCHGRGRLRCTSCGGSGRDRHYDHDRREWIHRSCTWCHGSGRRRCYTCHGYGQVTCTVCAGKCTLKWFIQLTILWTNHSSDHIVERTALPDHLIRNVTGQIAFEETQVRVYPIIHFHDNEINNASQRLVSSHSTSFPTERILMQRHKVRIIPVTEVKCRYNDQNMDYFVYGFEHKVHAPDYPQQCCCGCTIL